MKGKWIESTLFNIVDNHRLKFLKKCIYLKNTGYSSNK